MSANSDRKPELSITQRMKETVIKAIIFDKDGTLFNFNATWGAWAKGLLMAEAGDDLQRLNALAGALGYDLETAQFLPGSVVIAEPAAVIADAMLPYLPETNQAQILARVNAAASVAPQVEAVPLRPFFADLQTRGLKLGVATNDAQEPTHAHLGRAEIIDVFDFIAGSDSGFGGKPAPGQLLAFCEQTGLAPTECIMVGDSRHDLIAGRAAGMHTVGVLTRPARAVELAPLADVVLQTIGEIPAWLDHQ